jgi:DNA-binding transcriptional LysR family regulator
MDHLEEWRAFVAVAGSLSFSGAARSTGRSAQTMTRAVSALEARLGTRLLNRTTRAVSLSSDGERILDEARQALSHFDALEQPAQKDAPLAGRLTLTASVMFGQLHLAPLVHEFLALHPGLELKLLLVDRVVSLSEEGIDLAIRLGALPDSSLRARQLGHVRSVLCASPAYLKRAGTPRSLEALSKHACIAFTGTSPIADRWSFRGANGREQRVAMHPRLSVNTALAAIDAALAGLGVVRLLSYQAARLASEKRLLLLLQRFEPPEMPIQIVQLPGARSRASEAFVEFAAPRLKDRLRRRA